MTLTNNKILHVLNSAEADLMGLAMFATGLTHDLGILDAAQLADLLDDGDFDHVADTLREIAAAKEALTTENTRTCTITDLTQWRDKSQRLAEIAAAIDAGVDQAALRDLDEERGEIEAEIAAYFVSLIED